MFDVVLVEPEIPPNTGNAIRLCANAGARLHLVEPLGFSLDDRQLRRAGLDYHDLASIHVHARWEDCRGELRGRRFFAYSSRARLRYDAVAYREGDVLVFGRETDGLAAEFLAQFPEDHRLCLPMHPGNRSLNLSNAVAIVVYEAWRQCGFEGVPAGAGPSK
jgi:tRNA (cytidine/uridine-2'-O-)-methyltransferase